MENYNRVNKYKFGIFYYLYNDFNILNRPSINIDKVWNKKWKLHRLDGPAAEYANGDKKYFQNGKLHRINGPAVEYVDGYKEWWFEGKFIKCNSQEEFERYIKLKLFW
jgi:hypothetical protein